VSELLPEAASSEAASAAESAAEPASAAAPGGAAKAAGEQQRPGWKTQLGAVLAIAAVVAVGSFLGYLIKPLSPMPSHPGMIYGLEFSGALICLVAVVGLVVIVVKAATEAKPAAELKEAKEKKPESTPFDFRADQRERHRALIWVVPLTLALAAIGALLGNFGFPSMGGPHPSIAADLAGTGAAFAGLFTLAFAAGSAYLAWPARVYGPTRAPRPWALPLKAVGSWLAITPFSVFCLGGVGFASYEGVIGNWGNMIVLLIFGLLCGAGGGFLLAGSGAVQGEQLEEGEEVSERVRRSVWWSHFKVMLTIWALALTVMALVYLVETDWADFWDITGGACAAWFACYQAAAGKMPRKFFQA
jgi:hypothetical protein